MISTKKPLNSEYGTGGYWETKYSYAILTEESFSNWDMYVSFDTIYPSIGGHINHESPQMILILGVGRSCIIDTLISHGMLNITAIDISPSLVTKLQSKYELYSTIEIMIMDVCSMGALAEDKYTIIIDKGCIDCLFCSTNFNTIVPTAYSEIFRVLSSGGMFFSVSSVQHDGRVGYMGDEAWDISYFPLHDGESLLLYILTKGYSQNTSNTITNTANNTTNLITNATINSTTTTANNNISLSNKKKITSHTAQKKDRDERDRPVLSTVNQYLTKHPRTKTTVRGVGAAGVLTVTSSLQELRNLINETR